MLCYVMLCYVMLCYVMLCYVMLCYVMLYVMLGYHVCRMTWQILSYSDCDLGPRCYKVIELCINVMCSSVDQIFLYVMFHLGLGTQ